MAGANRKALWGWALYDWANSAFATTVMAGFFPLFFKTYWSAGADLNVSTARLGFGNAIASLLIALIAPVLGAVADRGSARKKFLIFFAYLGVLMTGALFMVGQGRWEIAILVYALGVIGFSGANIFYDSLLPAVSEENRIDFVSGLGYAMGYLGGGVLFLINVLMVLMPRRFGLGDMTEAIRYAFLTVAFWWGAFTVFTLCWVPEPRGAGAPGISAAVREGVYQFAATVQKIRHLKTVILFLAAYWFYIDGVDTVIRMAVDYGLSLGFASTDMIIALLIVQFIGFPAALAFGKLAQKWNVRKAIFLAIGVYMGVTLFAMGMSRKEEFYILAAVVGLVQGGIQASSRSYFARLIPRAQAGEFFGFYNMLGRFAAILGPALMGSVGLAVKRLLTPAAPSPEQLRWIGQTASRAGIASLLILFALGALLLYLVDEQRGKSERDAYEFSLHHRSPDC